MHLALAATIYLPAHGFAGRAAQGFACLAAHGFACCVWSVPEAAGEMAEPDTNAIVTPPAASKNKGRTIFLNMDMLLTRLKDGSDP